MTTDFKIQFNKILQKAKLISPVIESSEGGLLIGSSAMLLRKRQMTDIFSTTSSMRGRRAWLWSQHLAPQETND